MRTWPGAVRGPHPEASVVAIGRLAHWIARPHPDDDPYGAGTPLARLVEAGGQVLALGAPLSSITLLHHAEAIAPIDDKRRVTYTMPVMDRDRIVWRTYHDIDTSEGAFAYDVASETDPFESIARAALSSGIGVSGAVGMSTSYVFPARGLVEFTVAWLVERFGDGEHTVNRGA
jgi:aminoglycoside 3-N-acetyltransferase